MPTKNTKVLAVRVKNETVAEIEARIKPNGKSLNKWLNWAISLGLRKHDKKES